ncbi:MAG TPA: SDR family oxidoreductase [Candidatus Paceibacterota bacterium]|nr:SDR family oxidoreductase [Candidatus Paceibacterota bacterium]
MGVANHMSLAAAIAKACKEDGAEVIITHHPDPMFKKHATKFAKNAGIADTHVLECDVLDGDSIDRCFDSVSAIGQLNGFAHCVAYTDPKYLNGSFLDAIQTDDFEENFDNTMRISVRSFLKLAARAMNHMRDGGSMLTLTYDAANHVIEKYNLMTGAKGALDAYMRLLAYELGEFGIRVNAISASPVKTPSGLAVENAYLLGHFDEAMSPLGRRATHEEIANEAAYLMSDRSTAITGQLRFVNCGRNIVGRFPTRNTPLVMKSLGVDPEGHASHPATEEPFPINHQDLPRRGDYLTNDAGGVEGAG